MLKLILLTMLLLPISLFSMEIIVDSSLSAADTEFIDSILKPPSQSIDKGSYIQPAMVSIKAGSFMMGSDSGESYEKPVHRVTIGYDFYIGKYEVTFKEYDKFCEDTGRKKPDDYGWGRGDRPVINVSWNDAKAYTSWLSQKTGKTYRLPTEAEWEYVARAGTTTRYSFGDSTSSLSDYAWYYENSNHKTHKVGEKKPNPWGLYDIHGNVWEWCEDWYTDSYKNTPRDGSENDSGSQKEKVLRGASLDYNANGLRSANRFGGDPTFAYYGNGFRVLWEH